MIVLSLNVCASHRETFRTEEAVLKTIEERIEELVVVQVSAGKMVDVHRLAEKVLHEFPGERCKEITAVISAAVMRHHGNAFWEKEEREPPDSENLRRIA